MEDWKSEFNWLNYAARGKVAAIQLQVPIMSKLSLHMICIQQYYKKSTYNAWRWHTGVVLSAGSTNRCGVEQWQLVGLITRRSQVQVLPPLLRDNRRPPGYPKQAGPAVFDSESLQKKEIFDETTTYRLECHESDHRLPAVQECRRTFASDSNRIWPRSKAP